MMSRVSSSTSVKNSESEPYRAGSKKNILDNGRAIFGVKRLESVRGNMQLKTDLIIVH